MSGLDHPGSQPKSQSGFTLIEVLVALVVTSLLLAIVMNSAVSARERGKAALVKREAGLLAKSLLAEALAAPLAQTARQGQSGSIQWRVGETVIAKDPRGMFVLTRIDIDVRGTKGTSLIAFEARKLKAVPL